MGVAEFLIKLLTVVSICVSFSKQRGWISLNYGGFVAGNCCQMSLVSNHSNLWLNPSAITKEFSPTHSIVMMSYDVTVLIM